MININSKMFSKIKDKEYRDLFITGQIKNGIPFQVRALRNARNLTQAELGTLANMPQTVISRIENQSADSLNLKTLLKLASAFDVALVARFEPIDKLIDWVDNLSPETMAPLPSEQILETLEQETLKKAKGIKDSAQLSSGCQFRVITTKATVTPVQGTLPLFDKPYLAFDKDVVAQATESQGFQIKAATK